MAPALSDTRALQAYFMARLEGYSVAEKRVIFQALAEHFWQWQASDFWLAKPLDQTRDKQRELESWLERLARQEPYQYLIGEVPFAGLRIGVSPAVLIPRPETEELWERTVSQRVLPEGTLYDLCSGSGCLALAFKNTWPHRRVVGIELCDAALQMARQTAKREGLGVEWRRADVLKLPAEQLAEAALIISNPPYVSRAEAASMAPRVLEFEPHMALFAEGNDPLIFYRRIAALARATLLTDGWLALEGNQYHMDTIASIVQSCGLVVEELGRDAQGEPRFIWARQAASP